MKNKIKIAEGALDVGIQSYQQQPTSAPTNTSKPSTGSNINIKKKDLGDPNIQRNLSKLNNVNVNVVEEELGLTSNKLEYLSEVKDAESGEFTKPFTIGDKRYQMVRALTPDKQKVMGVYSLDETDESGENIIYSVDDFEENIAKKNIPEEGVVEPDGPEMNTLLSTEENVIDKPADEVNPQSKADDTHPSFAGFKHYIVNKKTGKARKFKTIEELAKANMVPDEEYMGIKNFKRYVDETLFGQAKKQPMVEVDDMNTDDDVEMNQRAQKLMVAIKNKIPENIIKSIATPIAQREVIAAFAEMVGVPRTGLPNLIAGLKDLSKQPEQTVAERKIIKKKDLI